MITEDNKVKLINRLNKIEGQVRGIKNMIEEGRYCIDILNQTRAITSGVKRVEDIILEGHLKTCVVDSFQSDDSEDQDLKIKEVINLVSKYR